MTPERPESITETAGGVSADEGAFVELITFAAQMAYEDLPPRILQRAKVIFLHNLVVALAARADHVIGQDRTVWPDGLDPQSSATRLTDGRRAPTDAAIVTNALAMGARAQHDEHTGAISHFGSTVLPPLLAAAEHLGADGRAILAAMIAGYEVAARIGMLSVTRTVQRGFRPTSLYGPLGGAVAVGKLLGLDTNGLISAVAFAANSSCGLAQTWLSGTDEWRYQTAFAARNGFIATTLAGSGVRGSVETLNGDKGFHRAFAGETIDLTPLSADLNQNWALDEVLLKPYPICALNQAPIQQLIELIGTEDLHPADIRRVVIRMNPSDYRYPGVNAPGPVHSRAAALMSLQTCAAIAVLCGDVPLDRLDAPQASDIRSIAESVELQADPSIGSHRSSVELELRSGQRQHSGPPREVVYDADVSRSVIARLQPLTRLTADEISRLRQVVDGMDTGVTVHDILRHVRPAH